MTFLEELRVQRWDDHRYYHHSRVNQTLHVVSALSFLSAYALLAISPTAAALIGWLLAMCSRQIGHFFFEPKGYDEVNQASHEHKEAIKIGYNLRRKMVLLTAWALIPLVLWLNPTVFGLRDAHAGWRELVDDTAVVWLWLGLAALLLRTAHLFYLRGVQTGMVWLTKILTDPVHDLILYRKAPLQLLRGEPARP